MQPESGLGELLVEVRPSWHLYATYGAVVAAGLGALVWLQLSLSPWRWVLLLTGLYLPVVVLAAVLMAWGLGGMVSLARHRLRLYERGLYQGPKSGRRGVYVPYSAVHALVLDVIRFPRPLEPLVGHYRIEAGQEELRLFPKMYPGLDALAAEIARRTGLSWQEIALSREAHRPEAKIA